MSTETLKNAIEGVQSFRDRILHAPVYDLSATQAEELARGYFQEEKENFEQRFVALSLVVPADVREAWGQKAEWLASLQGDIDRGDTRGLKHFVIGAGMDINRHAHAGEVVNRGQQKFGNALYMIGARMQASVAEK